MKIRGQLVKDPKKRLMELSKLNPKKGCLEWIGSRRGTGINGYGRVCVGSRSNGTRKTVSAHRYSYEIFVGSIPEGMWVLHKCDNPPCINPEHLFLGDRMDNTLDRDNKGRNKITAGQNNGFAKLTEQDVNEIRAAF